MGPPLIPHGESAKEPPTGVQLVPTVQDTLQKLGWRMLTNGPTLADR